MFEINQSNLCEFAENGDLDNLKLICGYLDKNGKNEKYNLDIAGCNHTHKWDNFNNWAIRRACYNGHLPIVVYLLENYPQVDITAHDNCAISLACSYGHLPIVVYLLENYPEVDITANYNKVICRVCENGYLPVVKYLLENYPEVDITAYNNCAIRWACYNGHIEIVKYLLEKYPEVDITATNNFAIRWACEVGHLPIVVYLVMTCLKKILDESLSKGVINRIINLLVKNDKKIEYIMLMQELKKRNIQIDMNEEIKKMEEQIEMERNLFIELEHHPQLPNGRMGIKCEEGLNLAMDIVGRM